MTEGGIGGFNALKALSTRNDEPEKASRPFDATRDGFVLGEGGGGIILEDLEHAQARGAKIYCEMVGGGMTADAHHITAPHPEGFGARNVMQNALDDAGLSPKDIDYVNVHGTSPSGMSRSRPFSKCLARKPTTQHRLPEKYDGALAQAAGAVKHGMHHGHRRSSGSSNNQP